MALPKKWCGRKRQANTGNTGALARRSVRSTLNLNLLDAVAVFALRADSGRRRPRSQY